MRAALGAACCLLPAAHALSGGAGLQLPALGREATPIVHALPHHRSASNVKPRGPRPAHACAQRQHACAPNASLVRRGICSSSGGAVRPVASMPDASSRTLRLRGGKDVPIDMAIFYWLENQGGYFYVISLMLAGAWYLMPPLPTALRHNIIATITPERKVELQWACVVMALAVLLLLAGPAIEGALGAWTLGFAPIAQCMVIGAVTYMWHSIGETIADARDEQLRQETLDPSQSSIATNYRILG